LTILRSRATSTRLKSRADTHFPELVPKLRN
jgi:hypothetical protein